MTVANACGEEKLGVALQWAQSFSHARWKSSRELLDNSAYIVNNTVPHTQNSVNRVNSMLSFLIPRKIILAR